MHKLKYKISTDTHGAPYIHANRMKLKDHGRNKKLIEIQKNPRWKVQVVYRYDVLALLCISKTQLTDGTIQTEI